MAVHVQVLSTMYLRYRKSTIRAALQEEDDGSITGIGAVHAPPGLKTEGSRVENRKNSPF